MSGAACPASRYNARAMNWAYWLLAIGLSLMVIDLTAAGLVEGQLWVSPAPWIDSVRAMYPVLADTNASPVFRLLRAFCCSGLAC